MLCEYSKLWTFRHELSDQIGSQVVIDPDLKHIFVIVEGYDGKETYRYHSMFESWKELAAKINRGGFKS